MFIVAAKSNELSKYMFFLTLFKICETNRNIHLQLRPHFGFWFDPRFTASDPMKASAGVFYSIAFKPLKAWSLAYYGCRSLQTASAKPRRKDIAMTETTQHHQLFDTEKYRAHLAPLELPKAQEDELLFELWKIAETLVDQSFSDPFYPHQAIVAANAFNAVNEAVGIKLDDQQNNRKQTTSTQEEL